MRASQHRPLSRSFGAYSDTAGVLPTRRVAFMLTANARPEHVHASRQAGADLHLEKPITSAMLFSAIGRAFEAAHGAPEALVAQA